MQRTHVVLTTVLTVALCLSFPCKAFAIDAYDTEVVASDGIVVSESLDGSGLEAIDDTLQEQERSDGSGQPTEDGDVQEVTDGADGSTDDGEGATPVEAQEDAVEDVQPLPEVAENVEKPEEDDQADHDDVLEAEAIPLSTQAESGKKLISYATHVQNQGWQAPVFDGNTAGTTGKSLRLESFKVNVSGAGLPAGGVSYRSQVQNAGWLPWASDGQESGTTGRGLRMEAIQIRLTGALSDAYDVYYRVHVQNVGWLSWAKNGAVAGSTGRSLRLEGLQVVLVRKGETAPSAEPASSRSAAFIDGTSLTVRAHVQNVGWMKGVGSGGVAGTTGRSLRVEALRVSLSGARVPGGIEGKAHVQNVGWQRWSKNGAVVGTTGRSLRVEAIRFRLTGEAAEVWDLYYRVHIQNMGWLSWSKNGEVAGTEGFSARIEAVEFRLCDKGSEPPVDDYHFEGPYALSGDELVDSYVWRTVSEHGWEGRAGLRDAFDFVCAFPLKRTSNWPGPDTETWSVTFAKEMLVKGGGNCHRYAALMRWFAKALGYEARVVPGMLRGRNGSDHGWLEVDVDGVTYVVDPAVQNAYPEYNWFLIRYQDAKLKYYDLDGNRILK